MDGKIESPIDARAYILAGHATVTLRSVKTGGHYTYRVNGKNLDQGEAAGPWFVSVLTGSEEYVYIGTVFSDVSYTLKHTKKSGVPAGSPSFRAFAWAYEALSRGIMPTTLEVWHHGTCGRCGRELTDPESIARGLGPICAQKGVATD